MALAQRPFPLSAGVLFGLGLGGFFDGIVFHQVLRWHHMLSSWYPLDSFENYELNTLWDGLFHSATYLLVLGGLFILWRSARHGRLAWSAKRMIGAMLLGFGLFNVVEGLVDHHLLGVHHVNERVPVESRIYWDLAFLAWGAIMLVAGWRLVRAAGREGAVPRQGST